MWNTRNKQELPKVRAESRQSGTIWRLPMSMVLWGQWIVVFVPDAEPEDRSTSAAEVSHLRFSDLFSCWPNSVLLKPREVFQLVLTAPMTQCWRLLKCPPICCEQACSSKPSLLPLSGESFPRGKGNIWGPASFPLLNILSFTCI